MKQYQYSLNTVDRKKQNIIYMLQYQYNLNTKKVYDQLEKLKYISCCQENCNVDKMKILLMFIVYVYKVLLLQIKRRMSNIKN